MFIIQKRVFGDENLIFLYKIILKLSNIFSNTNVSHDEALSARNLRLDKIFQVSVGTTM